MDQLLERLQQGTLTREALVAAWKANLDRASALGLLDAACEEAETFVRRNRALRDAFDAHFDGKFTLSIPCLLPQIEGILRDLSTKPPHDQATPAVPTDGWGNRLAFEVGEHAVEFNAFLFDLFKGQTRDDAFNRNPILHGANPGYDDETWSLILVLTVLEIRLFHWFRTRIPVSLE